jgi:hypothetical protein
VRELKRKKELKQESKKETYNGREEIEQQKEMKKTN